jgi:hypothetical protein
VNAQVADLRSTIIPKSDQLNADSLIGGPMTITVTAVKLMGDEQPVAIEYEGGVGKPYKPCKSMRRVMVLVWGEDGNKYAGRRMTLYRDDRVKFGSDQVGGIRISHMSHIDREQVLALTTTRGKRAPYSVKPLPNEPTRRPAAPETSQAPATLPDRVAAFRKRLAEAPNAVKVESMWAASAALREALDAADPDETGATVAMLEREKDARLDAIKAAENGADDFPGDRP